MATDPVITGLLPHRDPFLWVDRIIDEQQGLIITEKYIPIDLDVFRGHYPDRPILPGVLVCEAVFQTGALLLARMKTQAMPSSTRALPVITRIGGARFKRPVVPGDTLNIQVRLKECVSGVYFFKGTVRVLDKVALKIDFAATSFEQKKMDDNSP